ncbi:MAG TPA: hypothetical protein VFB79_17810 [Candidatus Angelobacter sp.]|nr:hypothetical protein [Candidatus Angelobacter sp.]
MNKADRQPSGGIEKAGLTQASKTRLREDTQNCAIRRNTSRSIAVKSIDL